jgi:hypothetical protein
MAKAYQAGMDKIVFCNDYRPRSWGEIRFASKQCGITDSPIVIYNRSLSKCGKGSILLSLGSPIGSPSKTGNTMSENRKMS